MSCNLWSATPHSAHALLVIVAKKVTENVMMTKHSCCHTLVHPIIIYCCCALAALQSSPQDNNQNASGRLAKESCSSWYEKCPADVKSVKRGVFGWPVPVPTTREGGSESGGISSDLVQGARSAAGALSDDEMATPSQVCGCRRPAGICVGTVTFRSGSDIAIGSRRNSSSSYVGP